MDYEDVERWALAFFEHHSSTENATKAGGLSKNDQKLLGEILSGLKLKYDKNLQAENCKIFKTDYDTLLETVDSNKFLQLCQSYIWADKATSLDEKLINLMEKYKQLDINNMSIREAVLQVITEQLATENLTSKTLNLIINFLVNAEKDPQSVSKTEAGWIFASLNPKLNFKKYFEEVFVNLFHPYLTENYGHTQFIFTGIVDNTFSRIVEEGHLLKIKEILEKHVIKIGQKAIRQGIENAENNIKFIQSLKSQ